MSTVEFFLAYPSELILYYISTSSAGSKPSPASAAASRLNTVAITDTYIYMFTPFYGPSNIPKPLTSPNRTEPKPSEELKKPYPDRGRTDVLYLSRTLGVPCPPGPGPGLTRPTRSRILIPGQCTMRYAGGQKAQSMCRPRDINYTTQAERHETDEAGESSGLYRGSRSSPPNALTPPWTPSIFALSVSGTFLTPWHSQIARCVPDRLTSTAMTATPSESREQHLCCQPAGA